MTQDLQKRTLFAGIALAIFLPILMIGGLLLQIAIGIIAMLAMHELLKMRGLETMTMEGLLTLFATFALTIPLENYLTFLPVDGNVVAYSVLISIMLGTTVFSKSYTIEDAVFPLAMSFYVGFGFNALLDARVAGLDKALLALCIVWATDSGAYLVGMNYGKRKLAPTVSPNKTFEGALGGILGAILGNNVGSGGNSELGAVIGTAVGGAAGAIIGNQMDRQAKKIEEEIPGAEVKRLDDGIVVTFDEKSGVTFEFGKSDLTSEAKTLLNKMVSVLKEYPDTNVIVTGHTDSKGKAAYNMGLSERRAKAVTSFFTSNGLNNSRFTTKWFGASQPIADNSTEEGRAKNRRVNIVIVPNEKMKEQAQKQAGQ